MFGTSSSVDHERTLWNPERGRKKQGKPKKEAYSSIYARSPTPSCTFEDCTPILGTNYVEFESKGLRVVHYLHSKRVNIDLLHVLVLLQPTFSFYIKYIPGTTDIILVHALKSETDYALLLITHY